MAASGLESAFSGSGLIGQLAFLLLILAVVASTPDTMRRFAAAGAAAGLFAAILSSAGIVAIVWWALLLLATLVMLGRRLLEDAKARFTPEEEAMLKGVFASLPRSRARHLLDQGFWLTGRAGDVLTREEEPVSHLFYLHEGEAAVTSHGRQVGACRPGDLIGEASVLTGDQASATVTLSGPARFWCAPATVLRPYVQTHDEVRRALEQGFNAALRAKLKASNVRSSDAGEVPA